MKEQEISRQYGRYLDGELNSSETSELLTAMALPEHKELAERLITESFAKQEVTHQLTDQAEERILSHIFRHKTRRLWPRIAAAVSILIFLSAGLYFVLHKHQEPAGTLVKNDIAPGGNKAILTLSNGDRIVLDNKTGQVASQAGRRVLIGANGAVSYSGQTATTEVLYNTLTVPIGNRRDLELPDGSKVSLDAGSSVTYPVVFDKERKISMTGQAYFVVRHDAAHPFLVTTKGQTTEDLGTEFNINAYDDEPAVKTTLISGSAKVNNTILIPGQQANFKDNNIVVKQADVESVTAWKDNNFLFRNQSLKSSMRQIARWYNVSVVYNNVDERLKIFIDVSRTRNLSVILKAIEATGKVKCSLEGRTITLNQPN